jgi:hypothetical protein
LTIVLTDDSNPAEIRRPGAYRAAVWCGRLAFIWLFVWVGTSVVQPSTRVVVLIWLGGLPLSVSILVLLHRSGARGGAGQFYRDVLWLPRR